MQASTPAVIVLVRDLLFSSKITSSARSKGVAVKIVRDPSKLLDEPGKRLIVDLNADAFLQAAIAWKAKTQGEVIGFVSHVAGDAIAEAKRLGIDRVMSNGGFSANVEMIITS